MVPPGLDRQVGVAMRGLFLFPFLVVMLATPVRAGFLDWWLTPDQQGRLYFERGDYAQAARLFEAPDWKARAFYMAGDFANAAALYQNSDTPEDLLNLGNALAKQEDLEGAIDAYHRALAAKPDFPEATFNLDWVAGLKELDDKEYDDSGGTGGKLKADRTVFDDKANEAQSEVSAREFQSSEGLSDAELQDMWMQRVQTTPADFLRFKFAYQENAQKSGAAE